MSEQKRRVLLNLDNIRNLEFLEGAGNRARTFLERCTGRRYPAHSTVIDHLEKTADVYFLLEGIVRVNVYATTGRWVTYETLNAGAMFGELAAIDNEPRSASVVTEERCLIAVMQRRDFLELVTTNPFFADRALHHLTRQSRALMEKVFEYNALKVKSRIYKELLRLLGATSGAPIRISDKDMASRVGTTRENVTRTYGDLRSKLVIEKQGSTIRIVNPERLAEELLKEAEFS